MRLTSRDIDAICDLVDDLCGVYLDARKSYLIEARLNHLLENANCGSYAELASKARESSQETLRVAIVDAITTNETLFFRDDSPFEALRHKVLPELIDARMQLSRPPRLRLWSAACSTGQEPYSLAITLSELVPEILDWDVRVVATDISDQCIERASRGYFLRHEVERGLSDELLRKYFVSEDGGWRVRDELRYLVAFQRRNLLDPFEDLGSFDVVLCRNVGIYFTPETRRDLFRRVSNVLAFDGCLFVGSSESLTDVDPKFKPEHHCGSVFYRAQAWRTPSLA